MFSFVDGLVCDEEGEEGCALIKENLKPSAARQSRFDASLTQSIFKNRCSMTARQQPECPAFSVPFNIVLLRLVPIFVLVLRFSVPVGKPLGRSFRRRRILGTRSFRRLTLARAHHPLADYRLTVIGATKSTSLLHFYLHHVRTPLFALTDFCKWC